MYLALHQSMPLWIGLYRVRGSISQCKSVQPNLGAANGFEALWEQNLGTRAILGDTEHVKRNGQLPQYPQNAITYADK